MTQEDKPFISVVVCAYNGEKIIHAGEKVLLSCLQSLAVQTYPHSRYEVIIIDDESTDGTYDGVSEFIRNHNGDKLQMRLFRIRHGGLSVARNSGIQLSKGEIIAFIDQDAVPQSTWLEELVKPFWVGADYVGGGIELLNDNSWVARFLQNARHQQFFGPDIFNDHLVGCNMAYRRTVFNEVGGFYENFSAYGDETTLLESIVGLFNYLPASNAVVLHRRPETVSAALSVLWKSATIGSLVARASRKRLHWKVPFLVVEQFLLMLFPILLCTIWLNVNLLLLPLMISLVAVVRRLYIRPLNRLISLRMVRNSGYIKGAVGFILFCFTLNILDFWGRLLSPWLYRHVDIIPPMTSKLVVLKSVESVHPI